MMCFQFYPALDKRVLHNQETPKESLLFKVFIKVKTLFVFLGMSSFLRGVPKFKTPLIQEPMEYWFFFNYNQQLV